MQIKAGALAPKIDLTSQAALAVLGLRIPFLGTPVVEAGRDSQGAARATSPRTDRPSHA